MATAACRPATELRLALALRHVRVLYPRVLGFLLLTGRVYKHDAYVYEISPECEVERAHTPREEKKHEKTRPSLPEHLLVRSCQQNDEGER